MSRDVAEETLLLAKDLLHTTPKTQKRKGSVDATGSHGAGRLMSAWFRTDSRRGTSVSFGSEAPRNDRPQRPGVLREITPGADWLSVAFRTMYARWVIAFGAALVASISLSSLSLAAAPQSAPTAPPTWSVMGTAGLPGGANLDSVSCSSTTACMAVGSLGGEALTVRWDGSGWSIVQNPLGAPDLFVQSFLTGVSCTSASDCVAVGTSVDEVGGYFQGTTVVEQWDGTRWSVVGGPDGAPPMEWYEYHHEHLVRGLVHLDFCLYRGGLRRVERAGR